MKCKRCKSRIKQYSYLTKVYGFEDAIRGMRNPMNSWDKSDSWYGCKYGDYGHTESSNCGNSCKGDCEYCIGNNDIDLMKRLAKAGTDHRKFMRMIVVYVDITAPLYWWKEFDTYKVGTVRNSCSTMHKLLSKPFEMSDFSFEHLETIARFDEDNEPHQPYMLFKDIIECLNACRNTYIETKNKTDWWQIIQLLPSSYNLKATLMLNYEVLANIYHSRKSHKLDEWREFCKWIESLPYSELITGEPDRNE